MEYFRGSEPLPFIPNAVGTLGMEYFRGSEPIGVLFKSSAAPVVKVRGASTWVTATADNVKVRGTSTWVPLSAAIKVRQGGAWVELS